jgi:hypothetical protein
MASRSSTSTTPSASYSSPSSDNYTATEWTQHSMFSDLMQQKGLLIGLGVAILAIWFVRGRSRPQEKAARRLVRDWRKVDDVEDARELLGDSVPAIMRPALLIVLNELERQLHRGFRQMEREISRL